jgi:hypothetical protein
VAARRRATTQKKQESRQDSDFLQNAGGIY